MHENEALPPAPDRPARSDDKVRLLAPGEMHKLGKGGTLASRQALLHSLVHIENWAIDLSWDIIARFGREADYELPKQFFDDFVQVAEDECRHFSLLAKRLEETGSSYGAFPAHDGLWESAAGSSGSLAARLAVEHCVHEARGLDVLPATIHKFRNNGDEASAALLEGVIYPEEVRHCAAGVRWLRHLHGLAHSSSTEAPQHSTAQDPPQHAQQEGRQVDGEDQASTTSTRPCPAPPPRRCDPPGSADLPPPDPGSPTHDVGRGWRDDARQCGEVERWFHTLIRRHFKGNLKPPFNDAARSRAGFGPEWYLPLAQGTAAVRTSPANDPAAA